MKKIACLLVWGVLFTTAINSCKKGCTNPSAVNYDKSAKEEDASCLYCDSLVMDVNTTTKTVKDLNSQSIYYQQSVMKVVADQRVYKYNGPGCAMAGYSANCTGQYATENTGTLSVKFENLQPDTIVATANVTITISSSENFNYTKPYTNIVVPPFTTVEVDRVYIPCINANTVIQVITVSGNTFTYR